MSHDGTPSKGLSRRHLIQFSAAAGVGAALVSSPAVASATTPLTPVPESWAFGKLEDFTRPQQDTAPRFRWWWPNAEVELDEIAKEVAEVARAGFGGLEIANVHHSVPGDLLDVVNRGWGSPHWIAALETALDAGLEHNVEIDVTLGPSWPAAIPTITPQSDSAMKELAHGLVQLSSGARHNGPLPEPVTPPSKGVEGRKLIAVQAAKILEVPDRGQTILSRASLVDLTESVTNESLDWTAPEGSGDWVLLAYWERGSGQPAEAGPHTSPESYVIDHFSMRGVDALKKYWHETILTPKVVDLLAKAGGTFFEDSLEVETHSTIWTPDVAAEFQKRYNYDLLPFLPVLIETKEKYLYDFDDIVTSRVRDDYNETLSDLYAEQHLIPLRDWAHSFGLQYRVQAYGLEQDSIGQAGIVDIPETESLGAKNVDDYRVLASGRDIGGRKLLSCEAAAYLNKSYHSTWRENVLVTLAEMYCGGVNQTVLHGFAYADAPGAQWPGFGAFTPYYNNSVGYSEAWGPRMPVWKHLNSAAAYISRTQWVLQQGSPHYDIAFYRQKGWAQTGIGAPWGTAAGIPIGWSQGFLTESSLFQDRAVLANGRFAPEGGNYRAFVVDIDRFRGSEATMSERAAQRLLELAKNGFPLVFFGNWASPQATGLRDSATNERVAALITDMLALPNVTTAATNDDIPIALANVGVHRAVQHEFSNLKHVHRVVDGVDMYYLVNAKHNPAKDKLEPIDQSVTLTAINADLVPYELNAWTGEVTPIAHYTRDGAQVTLRMQLQPAQSTIIALAPAGWAETRMPAASVQSTSADSVQTGPNGEVFLRASTAGLHTAQLADGRTKQAVVAPIPDPVEITKWQLTVDDWRPAATGVSTVHETQSHDLTALAPWSELGMDDVAGVGDYRSTFTIDENWRPGTGGVTLSLGSVLDTFRVWVNSIPVTGVDLTDTTIDISRYVREGRNTLRVEVASTLINRLRVTRPDVYGVIGVQNYGLMGPVTVTPYGRARVA